MVKRYELTNAQWECTAALLPSKAGDPGRTAADNRMFVNSVLWILRSGAHWHDLPERYGKWKSVHTRLSRWAKKGAWERVFKVLIEDPRTSISCSTPLWFAPISRQRPEKRAKDQALGRSRGGLTTKIHMLADGLGRPLRFILTGGQAHDFVAAPALLKGVQGGAVIAEADMFAVISSRRSRKMPILHDTLLYKTRNRIERCFNKL